MKGKVVEKINKIDKFLMKIFMSIKSTVLLKWTNPLKDANYHEEIDIMNSLVCVKKNYICS